MDIKKIVIIAAVALLAIIGFNYYSSAQSEKARAARMAEIETLRAKNAQAAQNSAATQTAVDSESPQPAIISQPTQPEVESEAAPQASFVVSNDNELFGANEAEKIEPENKKVDDSICDSIIKVAESIMRNRQNGISIAKSLEVVSSVRDGTPANEAVSALTKQIVIQAYEAPSFSTEIYKDDAVREFGAKQYLACMRAFN